MTVRQLKKHLLQFKIDAVDNRDIRDRCIGRKGLNLNISGTIQLAKKFLNSIKQFGSVRGCSDISNVIPESAYPLILFLTWHLNVQKPQQS